MKNNIFFPGTKFKVIEPTTDNTYTVGSTGFLSYLERTDSSFMNVAQCRAVMTRRGKGGKNRMNLSKIYIPVFTIDDENFNKAMPSDGLRKFFMYIEEAVPPYTSIMEFNDVDFLGWAYSKVRMLRYMSEKCKHGKWPDKKSHPFNQLGRLHEYYENDPARFENECANPDYRVNFITKLIPAQASLVRVILKQAVLRAETIHTAAEFIEFTNSGAFIPKDAEKKDNEYRFTEDEDSLKDNIKRAKDVLKTVSKLSKDKSKRP